MVLELIGANIAKASGMTNKKRSFMNRFPLPAFNSCHCQPQQNATLFPNACLAYHLNNSKITRNNVLSHNAPPSVLKIHKHFNPPTFTSPLLNANETKKKKTINISTQYSNNIIRNFYVFYAIKNTKIFCNNQVSNYLCNVFYKCTILI